MQQTSSPDFATLVSLRSERDGPAFIEGASGRTLRWSDLAGHAASWSALLAPGPVEGLRVGLAIADPLLMAAAFVGAVASGVTAVPLEPGLTPDAVRRARLTGVSVVVVGAADQVDPYDDLFDTTELWMADESGLRRVGPARTARRHLPTDIGLILTSSGTTGSPKLIPLSAAQLLRTARSVVDEHRLRPNDRGFSPLPLTHINGLVVGVTAALVNGHSLILDRRFSASAFWGVVARHRPTWLNLVPAIISILGSRPAPDPTELRSIRFARSASAPLPAPAMRSFETRTGIMVVETYGMTEAASQIATNPCSLGRRRPGSVGFPVDLSLRIVDPDGRPVRTGQIGEIQIAGDRVISSYLTAVDSDEPARAARDAEGWLSSGDLGHFDADGYLYLVGRTDDVINRGGEKVYPREVEEVILEDPDVREVAVIAQADRVAGEVPVAVILARNGVDEQALVTRLFQRCGRDLSRHRRPVRVVVVASLPTGPNGKIRRSELRRTLANAAG